MIPGPAELAPEALAALGAQVVPHYGEDWAAVHAHVTAGLGSVLGAAEPPFLIPGSGSAGLDAALLGLFAPGERVVTCATGYFGDRMAEMARRQGLEVTPVPVEPGRAVDPGRVADAARGAAGVLCVHVETATGVRHPVAELAEVARNAGALLVVDAIASAGGERLAVDADGIDALATAPQKGLEGPAGLAIVALRPRARERLDALPPRPGSWYLDLRNWDRHRREHADWEPHPVTMPTSLVLSLWASLQPLLGGGVAARVDERARVAARLREGLRDLGLPPVAARGCEAALVTVVRAPEPARVARRLSEDHGIVVGRGLAPVDDAIRIGLVGARATAAMVDRLLDALRATVARRPRTRRTADDTAPVAAGPVEQALAGAVGAGALAVEFLPRSRLGEVRVHLEPLLGAGALDADRCRDAARSLATIPGVVDAVAVPPRAYLRLDTAFLYDAVVAAVEREGLAYGGSDAGGGRRVVVSFSDPNVNKPLHLGHLRNNFVGMALGNLLAARGHRVHREAIHTDWGIHICQALVALRRWGGDATPASTGTKGDRLVGDLYVRFHAERAAEGMADELNAEAAGVLRGLMAGDAALRRDYERLVGWADEGIRQTYARIGTRHDRIVYESHYVDDCMLLMDEGLASGLWSRRPDGSAYADLEDAGLGQVTMLRRDGTPVVYSQWVAVDLGRFGGGDFEHAYLLMGAEWHSGLAVHLELLSRLGAPWVDRLEPVYYGMVNLPQGRIKSRAGTAIAADDVLDDLCARLAADGADEATAEVLGLALAKYHLLRVRRTNDLVHHEDALFSDVLPRFARIVRALAFAEQARGGSATGNRKPPRAARPLLLRLNGLAAAVDAAVARRDPAVLVRFLDGLAGDVASLGSVLARGDPLWAAAAIGLRRALALLNIRVPTCLHGLPRAFALERDRVAGAR